MSINNTEASYGSVAKFFHWTIAVVIYTMLFVGYYMGSIEPDSTKFKVYMLHKSFGLTVLLLVLLRFIWRMKSTVPTLPDSVPGWQKLAARLVQYGLYTALILMPLSGWIMSCAAGYVPTYFDLFAVPLPGIEKSKALAHTASSAHEIIAIVLISLIVIHVLAALKHHFIDKDNVLRSMLPFVRMPENPRSQEEDQS